MAPPQDLELTPTSKRPLRLSADTVRRVLDQPLPSGDDDTSGRPLPCRSSIVIVTYDNLVLTRLCLESVLATTGPGTEVIVVDNASSDGTWPYLRTMSDRYPRLRLLPNDRNLGFVRAANQGLAAAQGDVLVLLNNDTIVPPGWLDGLARHLSDSAVGLVGPVTNSAGNEARIPVTYRTYGEMLSFAATRQDCPQPPFDIPVLTMFCTALRRDVHVRLGDLDEQFGLGMFEDDDYAERARAAGLRVVCAPDVFVHHFGEASFGKLVPTGEYGELFRANQQHFVEKWGKAWKPHDRMPDPDYAAVIDGVRTAVRAQIPLGATVLVVSRGDEALLELDGRRGQHFPQDGSGGYAGHHPADDAAAIEQLEALHAGGAEYLLFPRTSAWWLDHYRSLRRYLESRHTALTQDAACVIFRLEELR